MKSADHSSASDATLAHNPSVDGEGAASQAGSEAAPNSEILPGSMLGQYKIIEKIGEGGMGLVFKATDTMLERTVALKVMFCDAHEDERRAQRFIREARAMARLSHPNLLHVYSVGSQGNCHYFAMELLRGETLLHAIHRLGRIPAPEVMHCAVQIIAALFYVHHNGIIHRDVKSGNIMLCGRRAVLMDFGLAKEGSDDAGLTSVGAIMGTPDYMPPEAAEGRTEGPSTDIYSLGVVLYEALSGRLPFIGKSAISIIRQHIDSPPPPLQSLVPELKPELAAVIHKCLEKSPADRYEDCPALASALWDLIPEQGLLDVAERRLPDSDSLERNPFPSTAPQPPKKKKTVPLDLPDKTRLEDLKSFGALSPTLTGIQEQQTPDGAEGAPAADPGDAETMPAVAAQEQTEARPKSSQWVWALVGFIGVFALVIAVAVALHRPPKVFKGQPVLRKGPTDSEREVLLEFKASDPDPNNWYFVVRRPLPDGNFRDVKIPYRDYIPPKGDVELHFLQDGKK